MEYSSSQGIWRTAIVAVRSQLDYTNAFCSVQYITSHTKHSTLLFVVVHNARHHSKFGRSDTVSGKLFACMCYLQWISKGTGMYSTLLTILLFRWLLLSFGNMQHASSPTNFCCRICSKCWLRLYLYVQNHSQIANCMCKFFLLCVPIIFHIYCNTCSRLSLVYSMFECLLEN